MYEYKIEYDTEKWKKCLAALGKEGMDALKKLMLSRIGEGIRGDIVKDKLRGQVLGRITGDLAAHTYWSLADSDSVEVGNNLVYARIHELGGDIVPVRAKFLHFTINGVEIFTKLVKMPARPYIGPTIEEWADGGKIEGAVEDVMHKKLVELGAE